MKRLIKGILVVVTVISALPTVIDVRANDFAGNESYYYNLCSSFTLTNSQIETCRNFSDYVTNLKDDNDQLISNAQGAVSSANGSLKAIQSTIDQIESSLTQLQEQLEYLEANIANLEIKIEDNETIVKDRMYAMQSYINNNMYIQFIFGANSFGDMISRTDSVSELTEYDKQLIEGLVSDKATVVEQTDLVNETKLTLEDQKSVQLALEKEAQAIYNKELAALENYKNTSSELTENQLMIEASIAASFAAINGTSGSNAQLVPGSSALGNLIATTALSRVGCRYWWGAPGGGYGDPSNLYDPNAIYFDCSGLVAWAHYHSGKSVGRNTAATYATMGTGISYSQLQAGDIITVNGGGSGRVYHIGIYIGGGYLVHASGYGSSTLGQKPSEVVRIDPISTFQKMGIYNYRRLY